MKDAMLKFESREKDGSYVLRNRAGFMVAVVHLSDGADEEGFIRTLAAAPDLRDALAALLSATGKPARPKALREAQELARWVLNHAEVPAPVALPEKGGLR